MSLLTSAAPIITPIEDPSLIPDRLTVEPLCTKARSHKRDNMQPKGSQGSCSRCGRSLAELFLKMWKLKAESIMWKGGQLFPSCRRAPALRWTPPNIGGLFSSMRVARGGTRCFGSWLFPLLTFIVCPDSSEVFQRNNQVSLHALYVPSQASAKPMRSVTRASTLACAQHSIIC